jgi:hypothetical protein
MWVATLAVRIWASFVTANSVQFHGAVFALLVGELKEISKRRVRVSGS